LLSGKTLLVTGGTGAIGAATVRLAAARGADVAFSYRSQHERAEALAAELRGLGRRCLCAAVEGTRRAEVQAFVKRVEAELGPVDALINNLGVAQVMPFALIEEEDWDQALSVNLKSLFLYTQATARNMIRRKRGAIVNVGSVAGHRLLEVPVHYATAKAAVTGFTLSMAKELSRYNIRVNEVVPGLIAGGIGANASDRQTSQYQEFCSMGRLGEPNEVAEALLFLASDRSSYINAQSLTVDGGL